MLPIAMPDAPRHPAPPAAAPALASFDMQQLRHHTKNALQRLLIQIHESASAAGKQNGRELCRTLERRIMLSVEISDALFGMTRAPGPLAQRLRAVAQATIDLFAAPDQSISLDVALSGDCATALEQPILQIAQEFVANAVKHGMPHRPQGRIRIALNSDARGNATLLVTDDGWGALAGSDSTRGIGLALARDLAESHAGSVALTFEGVTLARAVLRA